MKRLLYLFWMLCISLSFSCSQLITVNPKSNSDLDDFEITRQTVECVYPYLEYKQIDWDSVCATYRSHAVYARKEEKINILVAMLKELEDQHIYIRTKSGKYILPYQSPRVIRDKPNFNPRLVKKYCSNDVKSACKGKIKYTRLDGNIGYVYISTFKLKNMSKEFARIMGEMEDTDGLIVDIRNNPGGYCNNAFRVVSWFIDSSLEVPRNYLFGKIQDNPSIQPVGNCLALSYFQKVINGASYSAGDLFAELMKQVPTVTVVGDTTGGGSAFENMRAPGNFRLPSGNIIHVGNIDYRRYDGLPWEGIGIPPDIRVAQTKNDIKHGKDHQLEYAIHLLCEDFKSSEFSLN